MPEVRLDHGQRLPIGLKSLDTASSRLDQKTSPLAGGIAIQSQALSRIGQRLPKDPRNVKSGWKICGTKAVFARSHISL
jgi:hypothetical protein